MKPDEIPLKICHHANTKKGLIQLRQGASYVTIHFWEEKMAKKRTRAEVDKKRKYVLKVLNEETNEGAVFKALMDAPLGLHVQGIEDETGMNRATAKKTAEELVRRGLAMHSEVPGKVPGKFEGYKFGSFTFPELWY
jgi:hypothetical protein